VTLFRKEAGSGVGEVGGREGEKKRITKRERERERERGGEGERGRERGTQVRVPFAKS